MVVAVELRPGMIEDERQDEFLDDAEQGQIFVVATWLRIWASSPVRTGGGGSARFSGRSAGRNRAGRGCSTSSMAQLGRMEIARTSLKLKL